MNRIAFALVITLASFSTAAPAMSKDKDDKARTIANEVTVSRVKTSDRQQKAVMDFIKG
jgi:hypothetical protein